MVKALKKHKIMHILIQVVKIVFGSSYVVIAWVRVVLKRTVVGE